jgi:hypothetical protein
MACVSSMALVASGCSASSAASSPARAAACAAAKRAATSAACWPGPGIAHAGCGARAAMLYCRVAAEALAWCAVCPTPRAAAAASSRLRRARPVWQDTTPPAHKHSSAHCSWCAGVRAPVWAWFHRCSGPRRVVTLQTRTRRARLAVRSRSRLGALHSRGAAQSRQLDPLAAVVRVEAASFRRRETSQPASGKAPARYAASRAAHGVPAPTAAAGALRGARRRLLEVCAAAVTCAMRHAGGDHVAPQMRGGACRAHAAATARQRNSNSSPGGRKVESFTSGLPNTPSRQAQCHLHRALDLRGRARCVQIAGQSVPSARAQLGRARLRQLQCTLTAPQAAQRPPPCSAASSRRCKLVGHIHRGRPQITHGHAPCCARAARGRS